jgi:predicted porin
MKKLMSKILFALIATALVATGAQAATVFDKDGFKYSLSGDLEIQLQDLNTDADDDLDVAYDDLEIKNAVSYELGNGLTAFGELDFGFKEAAEGNSEDDSINMEEAYLGLGYENYTIRFGKTTSAGDDFGISQEIDLIGGDGFVYCSGDDLIKITADFDMVSVVAAYELQANDGSGSSFYDILVSASVAGIDAAVAYENNSDLDVDTFGISLAYDAEVVTVAADYTVTDYDGTDVDVWNFAAVVPVTDAATVAAGYVYTDVEGDDDEVNGYYLNVAYMLHNNVKLFAELGDSDEDDVDMAYLAGLQVVF